MTDILITFEDGKMELRPDNAPFRHRIPDYDEDLFREGLPSWPQVRRYVHTFDNCGRSGDKVFVWCEVGERADGKPLSGEWRLARVETVKEQLDRLTRECDVARRALGKVAKAIEHATELLSDQRAVLQRLEQSTRHPLDAHEAGVAEETVDQVVEELGAALAATKGASQ